MIKLITDKQGRQIAVLENDTHLSKWVEECGDLCHDPMVRQKIVPMLKPGDVVVDVGANIGDHTIAYAEAVGPTGKVHAFEPQGKAFACLVLNTGEFPYVLPYYYGLSDRAGLEFMHIESGNQGASYITASRNPELYPTLVIPLDFLNLPQLDFMKIDVEGYESNVLDGAICTIERHRPIVLCELNRRLLARTGTTPKQIVHFFEHRGYRLDFLQSDYSLDMEQVDALFLPK